ncbi:Tyrosine recombinase XerC [Caulifigura coniformis]|uniref:Tyrosine recombinase XerC n=1 Tax=Caulifigura coniformis TaxID=2527983 RepID=A0A517SCK9_9PLAN|nr:tyrosine-type recombinase/integrase [Caulifigura coniformis]QDT53867.1 Tyrosine recombinase XerC [Caulifigura coniformis]
MPRLIMEAGTAAEFAWDEFFAATLRNPHTRAAYRRAVVRFLTWAEQFDLPLARLTPALAGRFITEYQGSAPSRKLALAALRSFFDLLVVRQAAFLNPFSSVRGERFSVIEGKTPEIGKDNARRLLASITASRPVGLRDRAIIGVLVYTAARAGAVASLRLRDFAHDGTQYGFRFAEKGGKSRFIPCRADLQAIMLDYLATIDTDAESKDAPLFRSVAGRTGQLTAKPIRGIDVYRLMKRRLKEAGLPTSYSPHSSRVTVITDLLEQGVPLEDVQALAGHSDSRTTKLYDRRQKKITRNLVERISI